MIDEAALGSSTDIFADGFAEVFVRELAAEGLRRLFEEGKDLFFEGLLDVWEKHLARYGMPFVSSGSGDSAGDESPVRGGGVVSNIRRHSVSKPVSDVGWKVARADDIQARTNLGDSLPSIWVGLSEVAVLLEVPDILKS